LYRFITLVTLCLPAICAGRQFYEHTPTRIAPGFSETRELRGTETHQYLVANSGELLVTIENLGRGTILTIQDDLDGSILRSANWRGPEYQYSAVVSASHATTLEVSADEPIAPPGKYRITAVAIGRDDANYAGEYAMFLGSDYRLRHYFGADDARSEALDQFLLAVSEFESIGNSGRHADALFEAAGVYLELGEHEEAEQLYASAESIWQALGDSKGISAAQLHRGLIFWNTNRPTQAIELFRQVAARRDSSGDSFFLAQAVNNMGLVYRELGDARSAIDFFRQALEKWQGSEDLLTVNPEDVDFASSETPPWLEHALIAMNNIGWAYEVLADTGNTEQVLNRALSLSLYLNHGRITAEVKNNLGRLKYKTGDLQTALDYLNESLDYFTNISADELWAAHVRHAKALVHRASGNTGRAKLELQEALRLRTIERDPIGRAATMLELAELGLVDGQVNGILQTVEDALSLLGEGQANPLRQASAHDLAGRTYLAASQNEAALQHHDRAIDIFSVAGDIRGEAVARANRALTHHAMGLGLEVDTGLRVALSLAEQVEDRLLQFRIMTDQGRIFFENDYYERAKQKANAALWISETLRGEIVDPILLRDFASTQREAYDVLINAELGLERPEQAWMAADFARARRFADMLRQSVADLSLLTPEEQTRHESLLHMRAARADERSALLSKRESADTEEEIRRVRTELAAIIDEIEHIQAKGWQRREQPEELLTLSEIQSALSDHDLILEYYFGDLGSGVWRITASDITYQSIPPLDVILPSINSTVDSIRRFSPVLNTSLMGLSKTLLSIAANVEGDPTHIIVVPDGALYYLPFSILLDPKYDYREPIVDTRDVSYMPSLAALLELRARNKNRGSGLAIIADPVFEADDPRLGKLRADRKSMSAFRLEGELKRSAERAGRGSFPRLPGTRDESNVIRAAAQELKVRTIRDTDANIDLVLSGELDQYHILHFATHGILDPEEPALSGLVLSGVAPDGTSRSQFLRSQDIVALNLRADLVVLSGCDTGLGLLVRGEGLHSLSRAFFYAGARQVVSSLWQVPDKATAQLMGHFYTEMLQNGRTPAAALRLAKLAVRSDRRWRDPYYWAAFIMQGDWRHSSESK